MDAVPVIDISRFDEERAEKVLDAAINVGFLWIDGHGLSKDNVRSAFNLSRQFFTLDREEKSKYPIQNNQGFAALNVEELDPSTPSDYKESFNFGADDLMNGTQNQPLPPVFTEQHDFLSSFATSCHSICLDILKFFGHALKEEVQGDNRAGAHSDYGSITLLFQQPGSSGLEIMLPGKGWVPVPALPANDTNSAPPILVNIGDQLSYWTAGLLRSTIHRVRMPNRGQERYSMVYFCHPNDDALLEPVPSEIVRERKGRGANAAEGEVLTAGEHLRRRLAATYGWKENEDGQKQ
ncbi:Clavaminate synthase-like protein [Saitoella complicata NRRL Y-17804]|uniref:Clavaminate synthase-like protein n=1 Tax=Saitoella complicata (strain BCRC 22490 / CBS 7301 / JCM 7358 / NBRC 10748 / NRRL Y-17804) TaxID=698492 RepID=UPI00086714AA|nr:Clavaminate synthase-like protein [Saitoella complicata NRRL Y-17804]ODQ54411.1 Clavaminate synthase-like protein [Saitoella complicata NRRL Y-17804]